MLVSQDRYCEQHAFNWFYLYIRASLHECFKVVYSATMPVMATHLIGRLVDVMLRRDFLSFHDEREIIRFPF